MYYTIYKITNLINNKIYIGKHKTLDINDSYFGSGKLLKLAIDKYGFENFKKEIIYMFDNESEMNEKEKELVNEEFVKSNDNYNMKIGGDGGWDHMIGKTLVYDENNNIVVIDDYENSDKNHIFKNTVMITYNGTNKRVSINDPMYLSGEYISIIKNKVQVIDLDNKIISIDIDDERYTSGLLKHKNYDLMTNSVMMRNKLTNKCEFINKLDERRFSDEYELVGGYKKDNVSIIDNDGKVKRISTDEYNNGNYTHITKNKVTVKDKNGLTMQVDIDDPKYLSGEYVFLSTGTVNVRDKNGNTFRTSIDDPKYLSGEYVPANKGKKFKKDSLVHVLDKDGNELIVCKNDELLLDGTYKYKAYTKGTKWYNDGINEKMSYDDLTLLGWKRGRIKKLK